jgi:hypothetical protein
VLGQKKVWLPHMDDAKQFFRDKNCSFTPNGRPAKKPKKLIIKQEENPSARYITFTRPKPAHCISLQQCIESRPPMRTELLQTPSPCTYNVHCSSSLLSSNKSHLCWIAPPNQSNESISSFIIGLVTT